MEQAYLESVKEVAKELKKKNDIRYNNIDYRIWREEVEYIMKNWTL